MHNALVVIAFACAQDVAPQVIRPGGGFSGRVVAVDEDSIRIQGIEAEFRGVTSYTTERGCVTCFGKPVTLVTPTRTVAGARVVGTREGYTVIGLTGAQVIIRESDQPARSFTFSQELAAGGAPEGLWAADSYRVRDVKVGDRIAIRYLAGDKEVCTQIRIVERPGGRVPASPGDAGDAQGIKYHERQNAENDWQYEGIPIPDRFLSPRELEARRAKLAPPPRAIELRRIPLAQP